MEDIKRMYKINKSLIGVMIEDNRFSLTTLKGRDLYEDEVRKLIQQKMPQIIRDGLELTKNRANKFRAGTHVGMSNCEDRWIEFVKYDGDFPIISRGGQIHISMNDKFNEGIKNVWLGDLVELIDLTTKVEDLDDYDMKEIEIQKEFDDYKKSNLTMPEWLEIKDNEDYDDEEETVTISDCDDEE